MEPQKGRQIDWIFVISGLIALLATVVFTWKLPVIPVIGNEIKKAYSEVIARRVAQEKIGGNLPDFNKSDDTVLGFDKGDNLVEFPLEITQLTQLTTLQIEDAEISTLPFEIGNLINLEILIIKRSNLETLPASIGNLVWLRELDLSGNHLFTLPTEIGNLVLLEKLDLTGNPVSPSEIESLKESLPNTEIIY